MLFRAVIALICAVILVQTAAAAHHECSWRLDAGASKLDIASAPAGLQRYIVRTSSRDGVHGVMAALEAAGLAASDFKGLRELSSIGHLIAASFSPEALKWLCSQQALDKFILGVELDQQVTAFSGL